MKNYTILIIALCLSSQSLFAQSQLPEGAQIVPYYPKQSDQPYRYAHPTAPLHRFNQDHESPGRSDLRFDDMIGKYKNKPLAPLQLDYSQERKLYYKCGNSNDYCIFNPSKMPSDWRVQLENNEIDFYFYDDYDQKFLSTSVDTQLILRRFKEKNFQFQLGAYRPKDNIKIWYRNESFNANPIKNIHTLVASSNAKSLGLAKKLSVLKKITLVGGHYETDEASQLNRYQAVFIFDNNEDAFTRNILNNPRINSGEFKTSGYQIVRDRYDSEIIQGQHFRGINENGTRRWYSDIKFVTAKVKFEVGYTSKGNRFIELSEVDIKEHTSKEVVHADGSYRPIYGVVETGRNSSGG